jgi:2-keto-3-deoxy-L-rhamnonate aldolase RhmA
VSIIRNEMKWKLRAGEMTLGFGVHHLRTAAVAMIAQATGHDWLFLDMEHGALTVSDVAQISVAALPTGVTPVVRICSTAIDEATRALDNGAQGIIAPHVDDVEQARRIASAFRYPPKGRRSWGGPPALFRFQPPAIAEAQAAANDEILVIAMIESAEAIANVAEIAAVEGIDALFVGMMDLTADLGVPGETSHPRVREAFSRTSAACHAAGKLLGMGGVGDTRTAADYISLGAKFILTGTDHTYLLSGASQRAATLRQILSSASEARG